MSRGDLTEVDGYLEEALGGGQYRIRLESGTIRGQLCGKMKMNRIRVLPGDRVRIGYSPSDPSHGIIVRRYR
jgi:translation initiation factor IF-1